MAVAKTDQRNNPVLVEVYRGGSVESVHRGAVVVTAPSGDILAAWGHVDAMIYPRSAIKPFQAIPLVETGAIDRYRLGAAEIALASASHGGQAAHVAAVARWLARIGLSEDALGCGAHWPIDAEAARALVREGGEPSPIHNNCSGKHAGFLTMTLHLGNGIERYLDPPSPVQSRVREAIQDMCAVDCPRTATAVDGCGAPAPRFPLLALARGFARLGAPGDLPKSRAEACRRITDAMVANPRLVAGEGRFDTVAMTALGAIAVTKSGAEGVRAAALLERGVGLAVKIDDGASRAADVAMAALLRCFLKAGYNSASLARLETPSVYNTLGQVVGKIQPAPPWALELAAC